MVNSVYDLKMCSDHMLHFVEISKTDRRDFSVSRGLDFTWISNPPGGRSRDIHGWVG
jgi:hypothetical protein